MVKVMSPSSFDRDLVARLHHASGGAVRSGVELASLTRWKVGGRADLLVEPSDGEQVAAVLKLLHDAQAPYCVVGETSNLLFDSAGLRGALIRVSSRMSDILITGTKVKAEAGASVPQLARAAASESLAGIEHIVGIPGTIGGLVLMNGGSQRKGIGSHVEYVRYADPRGEISVVSPDECDFAYRSSSLQGRDGAIVEVGLRLAEGHADEINGEMDAIVAARRARFPEDQPNCGSTFVSNPSMYSVIGPPGKAVEDAGLKGYRIGGAQISAMHANFINNIGGATSDDVLAVIGTMRSRVFERTGFLMEAEVRYVSPVGDMMPAHIETDRREAQTHH